MIKLSGYGNNHAHITGDFAEHLVMYWLSIKGHECAHVQHVGIDVIANFNGTRIGISVKGRSRKEGEHNTRITMNKPKKHIELLKETCKNFGCKEYFAFVLDQMGKIKVILTPLTCIENHYVISDKSSQDWNTIKFENDSSSKTTELIWN